MHAIVMVHKMQRMALSNQHLLANNKCQPIQENNGEEKEEEEEEEDEDEEEEEVEDGVVEQGDDN